jgi:hypothetical protein
MSARRKRTAEEKETARAKRAETLTRRSREEKTRKAELQRMHLRKKEEIFVIVGTIRETLNNLGETERKRSRLMSHLSGFYEEIDKLARGKTMLPVTDRMVETANAIIRDARSLITNDDYLTNVREFVPAGDNPVFPDILVELRTVRQALERAEAFLEESESSTDDLLKAAETIEAALNVATEPDDIPTRGEIAETLDDDRISDEWLNGPTEYACFNMARLGETDLEEYFNAGAKVGE